MYVCGMQTAHDINDQLLRHTKTLAAHHQTSLTRLIEEGLQLRLRAHVAQPRIRVCLPVFESRGGLVANLNLRSNKSLLVALRDDGRT